MHSMLQSMHGMAAAVTSAHTACCSHPACTAWLLLSHLHVHSMICMHSTLLKLENCVWSGNIGTPEWFCHLTAAAVNYGIAMTVAMNLIISPMWHNLNHGFSGKNLSKVHILLEMKGWMCFVFLQFFQLDMGTTWLCMITTQYPSQPTTDSTPAPTFHHHTSRQDSYQYNGQDCRYSC